MYFDGQGVQVYFCTMAAALIPVMFLVVACGLQTGSMKYKLCSWLLVLLSISLVVFIALHNLIL